MSRRGKGRILVRLAAAALVLAEAVPLVLPYTLEPEPGAVRAGRLVIAAFFAYGLLRGYRWGVWLARIGAVAAMAGVLIGLPTLYGLHIRLPMLPLAIVIALYAFVGWVVLLSRYAALYLEDCAARQGLPSS